MTDCCCDMDYYHLLTEPEKMWPGDVPGRWEIYHVHVPHPSGNAMMGTTKSKRVWVPYPSGKETMLANIRETYLSKRGE